MNVFEPTSLHLGHNALSGDEIRIPLKEICRHWHVMGMTGSGKTRALLAMADAIIQSRKGLVVIDGKGELVYRLLEYCAEYGLEDRIAAVIDPMSSWAVGLNYLEPQGAVDPQAHAGRVVDDFKKIFDEPELKPLLEKWLPAAVEPLSRLCLTLCEVEAFISVRDSSFREAVFGLLGLSPASPLVRRWEELLSVRREERAMQMLALQNRAALLTQVDMARAMFGSRKTTVNWKEVVDEGKIVLVSAYDARNVPLQFARAIGVTVIRQLMEVGMSRDPEKGPDAFVMCDEFQMYAGDDFCRSLAQMRSFRLWFVLANQYFEQLRSVPGLVEGILTNCDGRLYFALSPEDAQVAAPRLFQHVIHGRHVKHVSEQTKFRPVKTRETVRSRGWGRVESESECETLGSSRGTIESFGPDLGYALASRADEGLAKSRGDSRGESWASGTSTVETESVSDVPFHDLQEFREETGREFEPLAEVLNRAVSWITLQPSRGAQLQLGHTEVAVPVRIRDVPNPYVDREEAEAFLARVLPRAARPKEEVLEELETRYEEVLLEYERMKVANEVNEAQRLEGRGGKQPTIPQEEAVWAKFVLVSGDHGPRPREAGAQAKVLPEARPFDGTDRSLIKCPHPKEGA